MPTYVYSCGNCNTQIEKILKVSDRNVPELLPCPECGELKITKGVSTGTSFGDPVRLGFIKPDSGFKEVLQKIHSRTAGSKLNLGSGITQI